MWFNRKSGNRRFKREQVLEVKLRSDQVRASRLRMAITVMSVCAGTVLALLLFWRGGEWLLNQLVFQNRAFAIEIIDIQTDGVIGAEQLRKWAGVRTGDNLMALDLSRIKRDLELEPLISSVAVERILPHTLKLRVAEREAIAQVHALRPRSNGKGLAVVIYHLDEAGNVMLPLDNWLRQQSSPHAGDALTILEGVSENELRPGWPVASNQVRAALRLITEFERSAMVGYVDLKRIDVSSPEVLLVSTGQGTVVTFGVNSVNSLSDQLRRWRLIQDYELKIGKAFATLDLSVANNAPARWLEASGASTVKSKPAAKPVRPRKKNV